MKHESGREVVALDFETTAILPNNTVHQVLGYATADAECTNGYEYLGHYSRAHLQELIDTCHLVFHNSVFELYILERKLELDISRLSFDDTYLMSWCDYPDRPMETYTVQKGGGTRTKSSSHSLGSWGVRLEGEGKKVFDLEGVDAWSEELEEYCIQDAILTYDLYLFLLCQFTQDSASWASYRKVTLAAVPSIIDLTVNGLRFDVPSLKEFITQKKQQAEALVLEMRAIIDTCPTGTATYNKQKTAEEELEKKLTFLEEVAVKDTRKDAKPDATRPAWKYLKWGEFNPDSGAQITWALQHTYGWKPSKFTATGEAATGADVLETLAYPLATLLTSYGKYSKLISSFGDSLIEKLDETGRAHSSFRLGGTITGRLSSSGPNLQQIPSRGEEGAEFRKLIIPAEGMVLVGGDMSQLQYRIFAVTLAKFLGNTKLRDKFNEGTDAHQATADLLDIERNPTAKTINFLTLFGGQAEKLRTSLAKVGKLVEVEQAQGYFDKLNEVMGTEDCKKTMCEVAKADCGIGRGVFGQRLIYLDLCSDNHWKVLRAERQFFNAYIQNWEASVMQCIMAVMRNILPFYGASLVCQVHDELLYECPPDTAEAFAKVLGAIMGSGEWLASMLNDLEEPANIGMTWSETH